MLKQTLALVGLTLSLSANAAIIEAYGSGNHQFFSFDPNNADLSVIQNQGSYSMDFSPDGTLYGVDRGTDAVYRINKSGTRTLLATLPYNDYGGGFTVSNNGQYAYWTNRVSLYDSSTALYRMQLFGSTIESMGVIDGLSAVSDIEFGLDGTLYAISGVNVSRTGALYTVDIENMTSSQYSPNYLGLNFGDDTIITSLNATSDGKMHMMIRPEDAVGYYMGEIDLTNGQGSIDYSKGVTLDGVRYTAGIDIAYYSPVPVPATAWLFISALIGLVGLKRGK